MKRAAAILVVWICGFGLWWGLYPDRYDPKNPHYVLWKWHLVPIDLDRASATIAHDRDRDPIILGKNKEELIRRFGYLKSPTEVRPYLRDYCWSARPGSDAMFLRNVDLMIVFTDGRASETVLCKG